MPPWSSVVISLLWLSCSVNFENISAIRTYDDKRLAQLREEVKSMFYHAYDSYIRHAYPFDELRPLSCDGVDTWGSYSLTLIDTLDTLAVIGNYSEFRRVAQLIIDNAHFDMNINVSVFETNIRIIGGLLSAHMLSYKAGMEIEKGWPCNGPLLRLAEKVARKLLPAFDTNTGMPYGTVNLRYGVPPKETPITCTAGVGTFLVEFGTLSRLTGDPVYERVALRAMHALYTRRSSLDLFGNHIDTQTGKWTAVDSGIGAGIDSYFEYLVKGAILFQKPELMHMFRVSFRGIEKHLGKNGWYVWATMGQGHVSSTTFQSLESYWPGLLSLVGEFKTGQKAIMNYHRIWKQYGALPELYNIIHGKASHQRESYPLRPELIESAMYLYRATGDPYMLEIGEDMLRGIAYTARTECGFATIRDVTTLTLEDRMESFFLAETVKYLYLLFDSDNFIHSEGDDYVVIDNPRGKCTLYAGGYIFNTEAHPVDPSAINCCYGPKEEELHEEIALIDEFRHSPTFRGNSRDYKRSLHLSEAGPEELPIEISADEDDDHSVKEIEVPQLLETPPILSNKKCDSNGAKLENLLGKSSSGDHCDASEDEGVKLPVKNSEEEETETHSLLERILKKLFEDQEELNKHAKLTQVKINDLDLASSPQTIPSQHDSILFQESKKIEKMVQHFESNAKILTQQPIGPQEPSFSNKKAISTVIKENRIRRKNSERNLGGGKQGHSSEPDLDLIFGTKNNHMSLSFYFSLKWLREFPDLIRQLIPSERFDLQTFYNRISENEEFCDEKFSQQYNFSSTWLSNFRILKCPDIELADRFLFFKSSVD